jgi:hypothetical protein
VVTTPTHTHYELAKACLEAGKHVRQLQQCPDCAMQAPALDSNPTILQAQSCVATLSQLHAPR